MPFITHILLSLVALQSPSEPRTLAGTPPAVVGLLAPGVEIAILEPADIEGCRPAQDAPQEAIVGCDFRCYQDAVRAAIEEVATLIERRTPSDRSLTRGEELEATAGARQRLWAALDDAQERFFTDSRIAPAMRELAVRRSVARLALEFGGRTMLLQVLACDAGIHLSESRSPAASQLRTALAANPDANARLQRMLGEHGENAYRMRQAHLLANRADGLSSWGSPRQADESRLVSARRRLAQRILEWHQLNAALGDSVVSLAADVGLRRQGLLWRAEFLRAENELALGSEDVLTEAIKRLVREEPQESGSFASLLDECLESRDASLRALSEAAVRCGASVLIHPSGQEGALNAVKRFEDACDRWEASETRQAAVLCQALGDSTPETSKAVQRSVADLEKRAWEHWRHQAGVCRGRALRSSEGH